MKENKEITINKRFSFAPDEFGWVLYDRHTFISKKEGEEGLEKESKRNWYFGKLSGLCEFVINEAPKDCDEAKSIATAIEQAKNELLAAVKEIKNR